MTLPRLYKYDNKDNERFWEILINPKDPSQYATHSGLLDGKSVQSEWKSAEAKNVGRSNETTSYEQCILEVKSIWALSLIHI